MEVTIIIEDGPYAGTYYAPANLVEYIGDDFVNHGSSSITLYKNIGQGSSAYPRIVMPSNQYPYYQSQQGSNYSYITSTPNYHYNNWGNYYRERDMYNLLILTVIGFCALWRLLHK